MSKRQKDRKTVALKKSFSVAQIGGTVDRRHQQLSSRNRRQHHESHLGSA